MILFNTNKNISANGSNSYIQMVLLPRTLPQRHHRSSNISETCEFGIASQHQRKRLRRKLREAPPRLAALFGRPERIAPPKHGFGVPWLPFKATGRRSFKPQEGNTSTHVSHPCFGKMTLAIVMCHSPTPVSLQRALGTEIGRPQRLVRS